MASSTSSINTIFCFVRDAIHYQDTLVASHARETENESVDMQDDVDNSRNVISIGENSHQDTTEIGQQEETGDYTEVLALDGAPPEVADILIHDIIRNRVLHGMSFLADHMEAENDGFAILYVINDICVPIAPHTHYWYQSEALAHLSLIEYCSIIKVIK
jgi:hypothetical protein